MALPDLIRNGIALVAQIAGPLRTTVQLSRVTGRDAYGPTYAAAVDVDALVEQVSEQVASADGTTATSAAHLTFFEPIVIHERDRVAINGVSAAVVKVGGLLDPAGDPYLPEAWLGK